MSLATVWCFRVTHLALFLITAAFCGRKTPLISLHSPKNNTTSAVCFHEFFLIGILKISKKPPLIHVQLCMFTGGGFSWIRRTADAHLSQRKLLCLFYADAANY